MRISSKGRYALVSMIYMARRFDSKGFITVASISERFGISKIYLEQVLPCLKGGLVISTKGHKWIPDFRSPSEITAYDILFQLKTHCLRTQRYCCKICSSV